MTRELTVTKLHISATRGANKRPSFGYVSFSDGKAYTFLLDAYEDAYHFGGYRKVAEGYCSEPFSFRSAPREAALKTKLG